MKPGAFWGAIRAAAGLSAVSLVSCSGPAEQPAPPRSTDPIEFVSEPSQVAIPVEVDLTGLHRELERSLPRKLWSIDQPGQECVASRKVDVAGIKIKTPKIKCHLMGNVTRGRLSLSGSGRNLVITMPIHAEVQARDIAGLVERETATADARVRAIVRLDLRSDWSLTGKVDIKYDWTDEPAVEILGQRVEFTGTADRKLAGVIDGLEKSLPRELAKVNLRKDAEGLWKAGFTTLELNRENPPVWLQVTPQAITYGGYTLRGKTATIRLGLHARTLTFVGERPVDPQATSLPPPGKLQRDAGSFAFNIPVIADYEQLEPVVAKALVKRQQYPFEVSGIGPVRAEFGKVTIYGTDAHRMAVGVEFSAQDEAGRLPKASGTVWLTGKPVNEENSRVIRIDDPALAAHTDSKVTNLLFRLVSTPAFAQTVGDALTQNFSNDYEKLLGKVERAIAVRREGNLVVRSTIGEVKTGKIEASGVGLYLPVHAVGRASAELEAR